MNPVALTAETLRAAARDAGLPYVPTLATARDAWSAAYRNHAMPDPYGALRTALAAYCSANGTMEQEYVTPWEHWERDEYLRASVSRRLRMNLCEAAMQAGRSLIGPLRERREVRPESFSQPGRPAGPWWPLVVGEEGVERLPHGMDPRWAMLRVALVCPTRPLVTAELEGDPRHADQRETQDAPEMYLFDS